MYNGKIYDNDYNLKHETFAQNVTVNQKLCKEHCDKYSRKPVIWIFVRNNNKQI